MNRIVITPEQHRKIHDPRPNDNYSYGRLQEKDRFRIVVLEPSSEPDRIVECSLIHQPMDEAPSYDALSYTWGDSDADLPIFIDGCVFRIRENLYFALKALRHKNNSRLLWVDAVCIDQSHNDERSQQVSQMGRIYSDAAEVLIWLGESNKWSDLGMDSIKELAEGFRAAGERIKGPYNSMVAMEQRDIEWGNYFASFLAKSDSEDRTSALSYIFMNPWWRRVWTLQEIVLARSATVHHGLKSLPWMIFEVFTTIFTFRSVCQRLLTYVPQSKDGRLGLGSFQLAVQYPKEIIQLRDGRAVSLSFIVHQTRIRAATDPRDKIYGILGLISQGPRIKPNYDWSVKQLYIAAFKTILEEDGDLRSLCWLRDCDRSISRGLPSWVPYFQDFSGPHRPRFEPISQGREEHVGPIYNASLSSSEINATFFHFEEEDTVLVLKGAAVDMIDNIGNAAPELRNTKESGPNSLAETISNWQSLFFRLEGEYYVTGVLKYEAFWRTIILDQKVVGYHPNYLETGPGHERRLRSADGIPPCNPQDEERLIFALDNPPRIMGGFQFNRKFFTTTRGYIGLASPDTKEGDMVCVLLGAEVPYVPRPRKSGGYTMIDECYTHGIMDGEVISGVERGDYFYQSFDLR